MIDLLKAELNPAQNETLGELEKFGWELRFVRHDPEQRPVPVIFEAGKSKFAVLDQDGSLGRYLVDKGSITVDGVSLTVVEAGADSFTVSLIPETLARTTLGQRAPGERVNLEVDILAKHVEKLLAHRESRQSRAH